MSKTEGTTWRWHARFGHLHFRALHTLSKRSMVRGLPGVERVEEYCDGCALGKQHRTPFPRASAFRADRSLELVHTDLCGPISPVTPGGNSYFLLVVDDYSRYMWLEVLKAKSDAFQHFCKIKAATEAAGNCKLRAFRSDRGGEFNSGEFRQLCEENGIKHFTTAPYSPQQNGFVERRNQTIIEMARCLLKSMAVPPRFWGEAVRTAVYILNRCPTRALSGVTPYEALHRRKPNVHHMRVFGCVAHVKKIGPGINKLSDRSTKMLFIGYEEASKCYRVYYPAADKLQVTRDVVFEESRA
jgi:transposase InsO family protein